MGMIYLVIHEQRKLNKETMGPLVNLVKRRKQSARDLIKKYYLHKIYGSLYKISSGNIISSIVIPKNFVFFIIQYQVCLGPIIIFSSVSFSDNRLILPAMQSLC